MSEHNLFTHQPDPQPSWPRQTPFQAPDGYWQQAEEALALRLAWEEQEVDQPKGLPTSLPYQVPAEFFAQLEGQTLGQIDKELPSLAHPFQSPDSDWSDALTQRILAATQPKPEVVVRRLWNTWQVYAAAASVLLALTLGWVWMQQNVSSPQPIVAQAQVPEVSPTGTELVSLSEAQAFVAAEPELAEEVMHREGAETVVKPQTRIQPAVESVDWNEIENLMESPEASSLLEESDILCENC